MAVYTMLQTGSSGQEVKRMQQALEDAGYRVGSTGVDGIYGKNTAAAVRRYQQAQALQVDGIAGDETLGRLYGTAAAQSQPAQTEPEVPQTPAAPRVYDPAGDPAYLRALEELTALRQQEPVWEDAYSRELEAVYSQIVGQEPFRYDPGADPLYRRFAEQAALQGRLAMEDTVGQASALTGGYANSYAQTAGQQQYGLHLQKVSEAVPELYRLALDQYLARQQSLEDQYTLLQKQQAADYSRYQDTLEQHRKAVTQQEKRVSEAYDQGHTAWKEGQSSQKTAYDRLVKLIGETGYSPTAAQLRAAGMTREEANAYLRKYNAK